MNSPQCVQSARKRHQSQRSGRQAAGGVPGGRLMAETCGSVAEVARDGDRLASSNLAAFCGGGTRRGLTNSQAAVCNRKHAMMESGGEHKLLLLSFFLSSPGWRGNE